MSKEPILRLTKSDKPVYNKHGVVGKRWHGKGHDSHGRYDDEKKFFDREIKFSNLSASSKERAFCADDGKRGAKHPTQKPWRVGRLLVQVCVADLDRPEESLIVVPFAGSGSELVAAAERGTRFVGFDLEPAYVELTNARLGLGGTFIQGTAGCGGAGVRDFDDAFLNPESRYALVKQTGGDAASEAKASPRCVVRLPCVFLIVASAHLCSLSQVAEP